MGCGSGATSELVQGVLLTMQQLFSNIKLPLDMLKQVLSFVCDPLVKMWLILTNIDFEFEMILSMQVVFLAT